jgi:hypothetical protein
LKTVELVTGERVSSDSEAWRIETLARHILRKPLDERRAWLADREHKGGAESTAALRDAMRALHEKSKIT